MSLSTAASREASQSGSVGGHASPAKSERDPRGGGGGGGGVKSVARASRLSMASGAGVGALFGRSVREQLLQARDILETGLRYVNYARQVVALTDQKSMADTSWIKVRRRARDICVRQLLVIDLFVILVSG